MGSQQRGYAIDDMALESLFDGVEDLVCIKQSDSPPVTMSPAAYTPPSYHASSSSSPSSSTQPSPELFINASPKPRSNIEKWDAYVPSIREYHPPHDQNYLPLDFEVRTQIDKLSNNSMENYAAIDDAYILYRQNQFEVEATLPSLPPRFFIKIANSFHQVDGCYVEIYAVKHTRKDDTNIPVVNSEDAAGLFQHMSAREQKQHQTPPPIPVVNGQAVFNRLQFRSATANNARPNGIPHPNQGYFRLVISVIAKVDDSYHYVLSRISPRLIVRGRNPKNFLDQVSDSHEVPDQPNRKTKRQRAQERKQQQQHQQQTHSVLQSPQQPQPQPQLQQQIQQPQQIMQQLPQHLHTQQIQGQHTVHFQEQQMQEMMHQQQQIQLQNEFLFKQQQQYMNLSPDGTGSSPVYTPQMSPQMHSQMLPQIPPQMPSSYQSQLNIPLSPIQTHSPSSTVPQQPFMGDQPDQPLLAYEDQGSRKALKRGHHEVKTTTQTAGESWSVEAKEIHLQGKVGINTAPGNEALSIDGNVLISGNYLKPSDQCLKDNIKKLEGGQLDTIGKINLVEYDLKFQHDKDGNKVHEIGVIAQQLMKVLPSAVKVLNNVRLADGTVMPELLVVSDRSLLFETIGATQELGAKMKSNEENLSEVQKDSQELKTATHKAFNAVGKSLEYLLTETGDDTRDDIASSACYCTMFGLGPAWTVYFLGFILPPLWLCGLFYIASVQQVKKLAGCFSAVTLILYIGYMALIFSTPRPALTLILCTLAVTLLGLLIVCGPIAMSWGHKQALHRHQQTHKKQAVKASMRKEVRVVKEALVRQTEEV